MSFRTFSHPELVKKFPPEVKLIFKIFTKEGDEIRLVGGSVRDMLYQSYLKPELFSFGMRGSPQCGARLMSRKNKEIHQSPKDFGVLEKRLKDFDFATKFLPEETIKILEKNTFKAVPTGVKFGTVTAVVNGKNFEITTLRQDSNHTGRHCEAEFVDDYFSDAARRDFTINALYLDSEGLVTDYFRGKSDLENGEVKFIGDAEERIEEDFLRILRFFRFSCDYASGLDAKGLAACVRQKENLKKLSRERIRQEFFKLISSEQKQRVIATLKVLKSKKILDQIFPSELDVEALENLFALEKKLKFLAKTELKIASLFLQKKLNLKSFFKEICATNLEKKYFQFFFAENFKKLDLKDLKQFLAFEDKNLVTDFYRLNLLQNFSSLKIPTAKKNLKFLEKFSLPKFPLNGSEVEKLGFTKEKIGIAICAAKKFWAKNNFKSDRNSLIKFLSTKSDKTWRPRIKKNSTTK